MASKTCGGRIPSLSARSAIVRATLRMRSYALAQMEFLHRPPQEFLPLEVQFAMGLELTVRHLSVGAALRFSSEALLLELSGAEHPISKQVPNL
jgi:hypothetical protein